MYIAIYGKSELKLFKNKKKNWGEMFNNRPNNLLGTNVYKTPKFC